MPACMLQATLDTGWRLIITGISLIPGKEKPICRLRASRNPQGQMLARSFYDRSMGNLSRRIHASCRVIDMSAFPGVVAAMARIAKEKWNIVTVKN